MSLPKDKRQSKVMLVGAGFSGLAGSITLLDHFKTEDFVVYDRNDDVGGTWWANTYPGCASDVPATWYSLSTDTKSDWSSLTPPHSEMQKYLRGVSESRGIDKHINSNCEVESLDWDDENAVWKAVITNLKTKEKFEHVSQLVFLGQGILVHPLEFNVAGLKDKFQGDYFHTAVWNHDVSLKDKKVVVVGNGCSATQVIPNIANDTQSVTQLFRSKQYFVPRPPESALDAYKKYFTKSSWLVALYRFLFFAFSEMKAPLYNGANPLSKFVRNYFTNESVNYMKAKAPEKYHDMLLPDFKFGCKRMILDPGYLDSLKRDNVDLYNGEIDHVSEHAVHMKDGTEIPADVIIGATGYDVAKGVFGLKITGTDKSETVGDKWLRDGVSAYETVMIDKCPNMFLFAGPNSATGHSSVILAIENAQMYVKKVAAPVMNGTAKTVQVTTEAYNRWTETLSKALEKTVFSTPFGGCVSWYGDGPGRNFMTYPWTQITYWYRMKFPRWNDLKYEYNDKKNT